MGRRDGYSVAAAAGRESLRRAAVVGLTVRQYRVLCAVVSLTALYSRLRDRVYLAQVAAFAYGVEEAKPWMLKKTREALNELDDFGLVVHVAPKGRPNTSTGSPQYLIGVPTTDPDPGVTSEESDPDSGASSEQKVTPSPDQNGPRPRTETDPAPGPPTEKTSEKTSATAAAAGNSGVHEPDERDLEIRRRIRSFEDRTGEVAGAGMRTRIADEVDTDLAADAKLDHSGASLVPKIRAAEEYGQRFALALTRTEFMDDLAQQRDWAPYPEVIDAAIRAYQMHTKKVC